MRPAMRYVGAAGRLRRGAPVPAGAALTEDPAQALAAAWRAAAADLWFRVPYVYEVGDGVIAGDVLIERPTAWQALESGDPAPGQA